MMKIRKVIDFFYRFRFVFIGAAVAIAATVTTLDVSKGSITESSDFEISYVYGQDEITYSGSAFMGTVTYEFRRVGEQEWNEEKPRLVGQYEARGKSMGNHGYKYTKISTFEIKPYESTINLKDISVDFGNDHPALTYNVIEGDSLNDSDIVINYDDLQERTTYARIDLSTIKVKDKDGNDITSCYHFTTEDKEITFNKAPIRVDFKQDDTFEYTGKSYSSDEWELKSGTLYYGAHIEYTGGISKSEIGRFDNDHAIKVLSADGSIDYTANYAIDCRDNHIQIDKAKAVTITSKSLTKTYNGQPFTEFNNPDDLITIQPNLLEGHHFKLLGFDNKDMFKAGTASNTFTYDIVDDEGNSIDRSVYNGINVVSGSLTINKQSLTITSNPYENNFRNTYYSNPTFEEPVEGLVSGDQVVVDEENCTKQLAPTTGLGVQNVLSYVIKRGEEDVTSCYNITNVWKYITVNLEPLKFTFPARSYVYDGQSHPLYYANGNFDVYDTEEKRENAALLATGYFLPEGWTYDVRIPSSFVIKDVDNKNTKPTANNVEVHIYDNSPTPVEVTNFYNIGQDITFDLPESTVSQKQLFVTLSDYEKTYDNTSISNNLVINPDDPDSCVVYDGLVDGDLPNVSFNGTTANPKDASDDPYTVSLVCKVKNSAGTDVSNNYHFYYRNERDKNEPTLNATINRRDIVVYPAYTTKYYNGNNTFTPERPVCVAPDGKELIGTEMAYIKDNPTGPYLTSDSKVDDYTYELNPDDVVIKIGTVDVTSNYNVVVLGTATVNVKSRNLYISNTKASQPGSYIFYDKEEHGAFINADGSASNEISIPQGSLSGSSGLVPGHTVEINSPLTITNPGVLDIDSSENLDIRVKDENDNDVTGNYNISHSAFHMEIVQTKVTITPMYMAKTYDGYCFENSYVSSLNFGQLYNYSTTNALHNIYDVLIESDTHPGELETGHALMISKYTQDCANNATDYSIGGYPYYYEYKIVDTNHGNADVTDLYAIEDNEGLNCIYVSRAEIRVNCNTGGRIYDGEVCTPPTSGQAFALGTSNTASAYISTKSVGPKFSDRYTIYAEFSTSAYDPDLMYLVGTYSFDLTVTIADSVNGTTYSDDAINSIRIIKNKTTYDYTIDKYAIEVSSTKANSKGMCIRKVSGLASTDQVFFGDEPLVKGYFKYTYDLTDIRIIRNGVDDVTNTCYNITFK